MGVEVKKIHRIETPEQILLDVDTTNLATYGSQEGSNFKYHYGDSGFAKPELYDLIEVKSVRRAINEKTEYYLRILRSIQNASY